MTQPDPEPLITPPENAQRLRWLRPLAPHLLTACVAIVVSLALAAQLRPTPAPQIPVSATAAPTAVPTPTAVPAPTSPPLSAGVARQEIADLRADDARLWTTVYALKAVGQLADAEGALRTNDLPSVSQALIAADYSLSLAASHADDTQKSPIDQFHRTLDRIYGDLYLYPDHMDTRLAQLRQLLLTLVDEPRK